MSVVRRLIREESAERDMSRAEARAILWTLIRLPPGERRRVLAAMPPSAMRAIVDEWWWQARGGQIEPLACGDGRPWRIWALIAARGFGKTRAGAEWVSQRARETPGARIALVADSMDEAARVMIEGESGILAVARCDERPLWIPTRGRLEFPSGAIAFVYGAERPGRLRGPQHHYAWCDELAKWRQADATWDNLMMGLRLGTNPRTLVTTTPAPVRALKRILALPRLVRTHGRTADNPDCAEDFREAMREIYAGTRLGRQELEGELLDDLPGALWTRDMIEAARVPMPPRAFFSRVVIGVDPPLSAHGDACGIVVCGLGGDGLGHVLADLSVAGERPEGWARRVAAAAEAWDAQKVVAEKNAGGEMVESVLHAADFRLPVKLGHAKGSKAARAEPVALRFETGRAKLAGAFPELEDELCALTYAGFEGPSNSPDRADAMVWAMSELFETPRAEPRIRRL
jgi:phage terminase large subunit-like protein